MPAIPDETNRRYRRAFTLVELVMVMAIVAILSAIAAPRYQASVARARLDASARRISADLSLARSLARATSAPRSILFKAGAGTYEISDYYNPDRPGVAYSIDLNSAPYAVELKSVDFAGAATITDSGHGVPLAGGRIVLSNWWGSRKVSVDGTTGEVTSQLHAPLPNGELHAAGAALRDQRRLLGCGKGSRRRLFDQRGGAASDATGGCRRCRRCCHRRDLVAGCGRCGCCGRCGRCGCCCRYRRLAQPQGERLAQPQACAPAHPAQQVRPCERADYAGQDAGFEDLAPRLPGRLNGRLIGRFITHRISPAQWSSKQKQTRKSCRLATAPLVS